MTFDTASQSPSQVYGTETKTWEGGLIADFVPINFVRNTGQDK